jgi:hypothetical protein
VTVHNRTLACGLLAATAGLWVAAPLSAQEPARLALPPARPLVQPGLSVNQSIAETIAEQLRQSGQLQQYTVQVVFANGVAELTGIVADPPQRDEVLRIVHGVPHVERVVDRLQVAGSGPITQVQLPAPTPLTPGPGLPGTPTEPMPLFQAPPPSPYDVNTPRMPPYAWPTYAPYDNYSRVAYPLAYPYNAWPFIGPCYPFPKVPLGWRSVRLQWEDGHWFFSRVACQHDWWHLRYW